MGASTLKGFTFLSSRFSVSVYYRLRMKLYKLSDDFGLGTKRDGQTTFPGDSEACRTRCSHAEECCAGIVKEERRRRRQCAGRDDCQGRCFAEKGEDFPFEYRFVMINGIGSS